MKTAPRSMLAIALAASLTAGVSARHALATLSPTGYGPVRIGMTVGQVRSIIGKPRYGWGAANASDGCAVVVADRGVPGGLLMFQKGRLTRISLRGASTIKTAGGVGLNATEAQVRSAYGRTLQVTDADYDEPPAKLLTYWTVPEQQGLRFVTDKTRKVVEIRAGNSSIQLMEGCS
jgi:hypothetical protein